MSVVERGVRLRAAAAAGDLGAVRAQLEYVDVDAADQTTHYTALHRSVANGHYEVARELLGAGGSPFALHAGDHTPIEEKLTIAQAKQESGKTYYQILWSDPEGEEHDVWRRYSEFDSVRKAIINKKKGKHPEIKDLAFPKKTKLKSKGNAEGVVDDRLGHLEKWLVQLVIAKQLSPDAVSAPNPTILACKVACLSDGRDVRACAGGGQRAAAAVRFPVRWRRARVPSDDVGGRPDGEHHEADPAL